LLPSFSQTIIYQADRLSVVNSAFHQQFYSFIVVIIGSVSSWHVFEFMFIVQARLIKTEAKLPLFICTPPHYYWYALGIKTGYSDWVYTYSRYSLLSAKCNISAKDISYTPLCLNSCGIVDRPTQAWRQIHFLTFSAGFSLCVCCALKFQNFLNIFYRKTLPLYTAFGEASGKGGVHMWNTGSQVLEMGCAEEWLGLKGPAKLGWRMLAVSRHKTLSFYTGLPLITYDK
jgi:hypothetical protein